MMNPVTGEKTIEIAGRACTLRFTWQALSDIEAKYGDSPNLFNPEVIAFVAAAGFKKLSPDMTAERIVEISPPLMPFVKDVQEAMQWAYFGPEKPVEDVGEVKKNLPADGLLKRFGRRARQVFHR